VYDWRHYLAVIQRRLGALRNGARSGNCPTLSSDCSTISCAFVDSSLDVVLCQFGVLVFPHEVGVFRETFHVLGPGGCF
jgi:ubiquinone/menaquinone biosynthesis C-methylase UbiE